MKKIAFIVALMAFFVSIPNAMAKSYVWGDPDFGFSVTYPDSWMAQGALQPYEQLKLLAPQAQAQCSFSANEDRRFLVYPRRFDKEILSKEFDWSYWEDMTANYQDRFFHYDKTGSLGRGDARYTVVDYTTMNGVKKRELIFASLYGDMEFVARCVSAQYAYDDFFDTFMGVIGSVDFEPAYSAYYNGYYRDFLGGGYVKPKKPNVFTKNLPHEKIRRIHTAD